tara:strand:+ start:247 stop:561 length:315 start_codon:yes stop_codon:yes gene_type:complete
MNNQDTTLEEIQDMLKEKHNQLGKLEGISVFSREKIDKINQKLDKQQDELLKLIIYITDSEQDISILDSKQILSRQGLLTEKINTILDNLRNIRMSLANTIRRG